MSGNCISCRFFDQGPNDNKYGWCRRHAPVLAPEYQVEQYAGPNDPSYKTYFNAAWPVVTLTDRCGDWESAEPFKGWEPPNVDSA